MKKIRIGKDIALKWHITTSNNESLRDMDLTIELRDSKGNVMRIENYEFVDDNTITIGLRGTAFKFLGDYILTCWKNKGNEGQTMVDVTNAFTLVRYTTEEGGCNCHE